tara:strand:+ start:340 stop:576 length:237 start_codon:yes stop_codon:yes gene_type:complete
MNSLPEEFFEELNKLLKVEALDELERDLEEVDVITDHLPKCGMDELVEKFQALDYLVGSNAEEESNYWEMKAEIHYNV